MYKSKRLAKNIIRLLLPLTVLLLLAFAGSSVWLVKQASHVKAAPYLMMPDKYGQLSSRAAQITDETWTNADGTSSRGWLLRGDAGAPAVVLFHKYGADRSYVLNLAVKLSEATNFTVLMPDLRGHGENPLVKMTSFGGNEAGDADSAVKYIHSLRSPDGNPLVGPDVGAYGLELGSLSAISAATADPNVTALALDGVPQDSDAILATAVGKKFPFASSFTSRMASYGTRIYFYDGSYKNDLPCEQARTLIKRKVLLLSGSDAPDFQASTSRLAKCFPPGTQVDTKFDLSPSGYSIMNASIEQAEGYDQRVIDFFKQAFAPAQ